MVAITLLAFNIVCFSQTSTTYYSSPYGSATVTVNSYSSGWSGSVTTTVNGHTETHYYSGSYSGYYGSSYSANNSISSKYGYNSPQRKKREKVVFWSVLATAFIIPTISMLKK
jgi:hypothetical protein